MKEYAEKRVHTQAIGEKCAGCVFKNSSWDRYTFGERQKILGRVPELEEFKNQTYIPVAFLLDRLGLKGYAIGQAAVSSKHANFFINRGGATYDEMAMLISHCKEYVHRKTGILLEEEIQYIS
jgi:UDP-N-acetylenolpyruvoylglucosamine reductase